MYGNSFKRKSIFPHRYSKMFYDFWWTQKALWASFIGRLKIEKDVFVLITGDTGCQPKGSKVLMSSGKWKNVENVKVGDEVISPQADGTNTFSKVKWVNAFECPKTYDVVEINRNKKVLYSCSNNHKIPFFHKFYKRGTNNEGKRYYKSNHWGFKEYSAEKISKMNKEGLEHQNIGFSSFGIEKYRSSKNCKIDPYALGIYLGDGHYSKQLSITTMDKEVIYEIIKNYKLMNVHRKKDNKASSYMFSMRSNFARLLKELGLHNKKSGDKFIPKEALLSDLNYRKRLLAGLIDSDGYFGNGGYEYVSKSKRLVEDIRNLVYSIGGRCREIRKITKSIKKCNFTGQYYSMSFYIGDIDIPIITKRRKRKFKCIYLEPNRVAIYTRESTRKMVYGFELESKSHWYITDNWMVTKNSGKSHFAGMLCFKHGMKEKNFVLNDGSNMFDPKDSFIIDPDEFAYKMISREGKVLWLDEARRVANRRKWYSKINNAVADRKNQNRKLFNVYFLCMPFEREFDPVLASHLTMWIWVRRGVGEIYCKRSGVKGGTGLNIANILDREDKYLKENPKKTIVNPAIHPEYVGRIAFSKLSEKHDKLYKELVKSKKATGDLTDDEKKKYGIVEEQTPENIVQDAIDMITSKEIKDKKTLWNHLKILKIPDDKKIKMLNFYLQLEGFSTFNRLFEKTKIETDIEW